MIFRPAAALALSLALTLTACTNSANTEGTPPNPTSTSTSTSTSIEAPVVVKELGKGGQNDPVDIKVDGPIQVVFRKITLKPGAGTGLHCHDGQLIAVVEQGVFSHYAPIYPGGSHIYTAGESLVEGANYIHEGKNEGTEDVVLLVTYLISEGDPLAETDLAQCQSKTR